MKRNGIEQKGRNRPGSIPLFWFTVKSNSLVVRHIQAKYNRVHFITELMRNLSIIMNPEGFAVVAEEQVKKAVSSLNNARGSARLSLQLGCRKFGGQHMQCVSLILLDQHRKLWFFKISRGRYTTRVNIQKRATYVGWRAMEGRDGRLSIAFFEIV